MFKEPSDIIQCAQASSQPCMYCIEEHTAQNDIHPVEDSILRQWVNYFDKYVLVMVGPVLAPSDCPVRDNIETPMTERPAEWTCVTSWNGYLLRWGGGRGVKYLSKLCLMCCIVNIYNRHTQCVHCAGQEGCQLCSEDFFQKDITLPMQYAVKISVRTIPTVQPV